MSIQGRTGRASEPNITKPFPVVGCDVGDARLSSRLLKMADIFGNILVEAFLPTSYHAQIDENGVTMASSGPSAIARRRNRDKIIEAIPNGAKKTNRCEPTKLSNCRRKSPVGCNSREHII
jgi:hypothetical protein